MSTTDSTNADLSTQVDPAPTTAPRRAPEPTAADLKAAVERADAQIADLEAQAEATKTAHSDAMHAALLAGQDAPAPVAKQAALDDRLTALRAARTALAAKHRDQLEREHREAGANAAAEAKAIRDEYDRKYRLALAACIAADRAFYQVAGRHHNEHMLLRDRMPNRGKSFREKCAESLIAIRSRLPGSHQGFVLTNVDDPADPWNSSLMSLATNHINGLFE